MVINCQKLPQSCCCVLQDLAAFVDATGTAPGDKLLRTVQGGYHDIWGGSEAAQYVAEVAGWVLQRAKAAAAAS